MLSRRNELLFSSDGRGGAGRMDLFTAHQAPSGGFALARSVLGSLNSGADEFDATWLDDDAILFSRAPNLQTDTVWLYIAMRTTSGYDVGIRLPASINVPNQSSFAPMIDWSTPGQFTFTRGGELYLVRYRLDSP
jgi:hypothetical protein